MQKFRRVLAYILTLTLVLPTILSGLHVQAVGAEIVDGGDKLTEGVAKAAELGLVPSELLAKDPNAPITRAEFCALLAQATQGWGTAQVIQAPSFSDTEDEAVGFCAGSGIVNGFPDGTFRPEATLTRQQAAAMLHRAAEAFGAGKDDVLMPHVWQDPVAAWCYTDVSWCYFHGIMEGTGNNRFSGSNPYTRAQAIVTVLRLDQLTEGADERKTDYYPLYTTYSFEPEDYGPAGLEHWLTSDGTMLTDAEMRAEHPDEYGKALQNCHFVGVAQYGVPVSYLLPDNFLGKSLYLQELSFFMNRSAWITDIYGNRVEVPGAGSRFFFSELYCTPDGCLAANFAPAADQSADFSDPIGAMVHYNLTTGEQLDGPAPGGAGCDREAVTLAVAGDGVYAVQSSDGGITVHGAEPDPVPLDLGDGDWTLLGFSRGLVIVQNRDLRQTAYFTPFGKLAASVPWETTQH